MSKFLRGLGNFVFIIGGLLGFVLSLLVVYAVAGGGGVIGSLFLFPVAFMLVPFYTLFVYGSWNLLLINYGSAIIAWTLHKIADGMDVKPKVIADTAATREEQRPASIAPAPIAESVKLVKQAKERASETNKVSMVVFSVIGVLILIAVVSSLSSGSSSVPTPTPKRVPLLPTHTITPPHVATPTLGSISLNACVKSGSIRIRRGPGTQYEAFDGLASGNCMSILGRNQDSSWVYMTSEDNKTGWVAARLLTIEGDINKVSVQSGSEVSAFVFATPTKTMLPLLPATSTHRPTSTLKPAVAPSELLCSQTTNKIGKFVTCKIARAYCDYLPSADGSPTFCNDRPYPNQNFALVVFGEDWSDYDGYCLIVSGTVSLYRGVPQILAVSRSQVSYCK